MNEAQLLLDGWLQLGVYCLGGQVLVRRDPLQYNPGTLPRKHRITDRRERKAKARWIQRCRHHQLALGVAEGDIVYI